METMKTALYEFIILTAFATVVILVLIERRRPRKHSKTEVVHAPDAAIKGRGPTPIEEPAERDNYSQVAEQPQQLSGKHDLCRKSVTWGDNDVRVLPGNEWHSSGRRRSSDRDNCECNVCKVFADRDSMTRKRAV